MLKFQNLGIIDNVLKQYNQQFPFDVLLNEPETEFDVLQVCYYKYGEVKTYRSIVYNCIERSRNGDKRRELNVVLSNDGFSYSPREFKFANISWYEREGFFILDDSIYDEMPFLNSLQRQFGAVIIFYYSIKHKRIDIRFKKDGIPFLMITFERGYPETDETKEIEI